MVESLTSQWLTMLKREDVKREIKTILQPLIDVVMYEINPYIYAILCFVGVTFILLLSILIGVMALVFRYTPV
jgi:hypothetical protein